MNRTLPPKPSLEHLKKQAKSLHAAYKRQEPDAVARVQAHFPAAEVNLAAAQLVVARENGFPSWAALKRHVLAAATPTPKEFLEAATENARLARETWLTYREALSRDLACAIAAGDAETVGKAQIPTGPFGALDRPALTYACFSRLFNDPEFEPGLLATVRLLLDRGLDPNAYFLGEWAGETFHETALYGAAGVLNHPGLTKMLLEAGADPNEGLGDAVPYRGEAVYHACDHPGHNECLRLLFEAGASQAAKDYCILRKLDFEDREGVLLFLEHGADPNQRTMRTPLSHALLRGRSLEMIRLLLDHGADPNGRDPDGSTPYVLARRYGNHEAAKLLVERGANTELAPYDEILAAAADGDASRVKALAAANPDVLREASEYGRQPSDGQPLGAAGSILHDLARLGQADGLQALIEIGMDPGARNRFAETPLHWACLAGRVAAVKVLVEAGAPLDVVEKNHGGDPIGWACWGSVNWKEPHGDYPATVAMMLDHGARTPPPTDGSPEVQELLRKRID